MSSFSLRKNRDGTVTFRCGRYVETIDARDKSRDELADALRWAAIAAGARVQHGEMAAMLREIEGDA